jgi:hypothetical protein
MIYKRTGKQKIYDFLVTFFLLIILLSAAYLIWQKDKTKIVLKNDPLPIATDFSVLDGLPVSSTEKINPTVVGIMIDNNPNARPQVGLSAAKIVYEAPAEGGITRYFAIYDSDQLVEKIGPVRSARPYFIDWIEEYDGLYMHCGGSPEALTRLKNGLVFDLNEMTNGDYFWRDYNKEAPHNLYTNSEKWGKILSKRSSEKKIFNNGWLFGEMSSSSFEFVKDASIVYTLDYSVNWHYDEMQKNYIRNINNNIMREDNINLFADTIIIQYVKSTVIDDYGRKEIITSGQGDMRLLRDGLMVRGGWIKEKGRTRFYDTVGKELKLKPGKIWIQIVPKEINIKIST